jgi:hypothetical protein
VCTRNIMFYHFNLVFFLGYQMEGMNPRGFFYQCLIHLSSTIPPCTTLYYLFWLWILGSMLNDHNWPLMYSHFPICKLQFITFPQNLHAFKKIVILVNDNLQDTNKLYKQTFMFIPFVQHISWSVFACFFFFLLVRNRQKAPWFSKKGIFCHKFSF